MWVLLVLWVWLVLDWLLLMVVGLQRTPMLLATLIHHHHVSVQCKLHGVNSTVSYTMLFVGSILSHVV